MTACVTGPALQPNPTQVTEITGALSSRSGMWGPGADSRGRLRSGVDYRWALKALPFQHRSRHAKEETWLWTSTTAGEQKKKKKKTNFAGLRCAACSGCQWGSWRVVQLIESFSDRPGPADYPGDHLQQVSDRCLQSQPAEQTASA